MTMEKDLVPKLFQDPEWNSFLEYRGKDSHSIHKCEQFMYRSHA